MTNDTPNLVLVAPAHTADSLSEGVVAALTRKMSPRSSWGPVKTGLLALVSGGLLPLILLPRKFQKFIGAEQQQLWHFAEWLRLQFPSPETERFQEAVSKLRFRWIIWVLSLLFAAGAVAWAWHDLVPLARRPVVLLDPIGLRVQLPSLVPVTPRFLFSFTARLPAIVKQFATVPRVLIAAEGFTLLLIGAHVLALWQIMLHVADLRNVTELFNRAAKKHGLEPVAPPRRQLGLDVVWILCAVALIVLGAWWGVPMMLAAAAQARYITGEGRRFRLALSARAYNLLAQRRPVIYVPMPKALRGKCPRDNCNGVVRGGETFCPACGTRVLAPMEPKVA
jgi:hypothetical protein